MTLQQLTYILAIDQHRHFARAAEACHVTQATLSMMVQKLEAELEVQIFDRSRQPVEPTPLGRRILEQARAVLHQATGLQELVREEREGLQGELRLGIIPTLAPYLLPPFLSRFAEEHPGVRLHVSEHTTATLVEKLRAGQLDMALLSTPLHEPALREQPLFQEAFVLYVGPDEKLPKGPLTPKALDVDRLWLLEEGHCMRDQVLSLCELNRRREEGGARLLYQAGSIETLRHLVDHQGGFTLLPEMAARHLSSELQARVHRFASPEPMREIGLVSLATYPRRRRLEAVRKTIITAT